MAPGYKLLCGQSISRKLALFGMALPDVDDEFAVAADCLRRLMSSSTNLTAVAGLFRGFKMKSRAIIDLSWLADDSICEFIPPYNCPSAPTSF